MNTTERKAEFVKVISKIARQWMEQNQDNRRITKSHVTFLASQMKSGEWEQTGEPVQFSVSGNLINGQHRLSAIIESGTTQEILVVYGISDKAQAAMDTGKSRSAGDTLSMNHIANPTIAAAMIKNYMRFKADITSYGGDKKKFHTNRKVLEVYSSDTKLYAETTLLAQQYYKASAGLLPASVIGGFFLLFVEKSTHGRTKPVREFFDKLMIGRGREFDSTITILNKKLFHAKANRVRIPQRELYGMVVKTWNSALEGTYMKHLTLKADEELPKILEYPMELFDEQENAEENGSGKNGVEAAINS